jgi:hypothetical protein
MEQQQEPLLRLNPNTGYYEGTFTVQVEAEIFRRVLFRHVEEYHVDPTDLNAWEQAITQVARTAKWINHPRAEVRLAQESLNGAKEKEQAKEEEEEKEQEKTPLSTTKYLSPQEEQVLWEKAMQLPVIAWNTLLTPLPDELGSQDPKKRPYYMRRYAERRSLEKLKEQLEPTPAARVEAIASAVNGNRLK